MDAGQEGVFILASQIVGLKNYIKGERKGNQLTEQIIDMNRDSPCVGCPREFSDKDQCVEECLRLKAFQFNKEYRHLPYYQKTVVLPQIANKEAEAPKTTEPITPKTNWKKTMQGRPKKKKEEKPMSEDPVEYKVDRKSTEKDGITPKKIDETEESVISHNVLILDFTHYQEIYGELKKQMELSKLPLGHVIMNVLSLGIMSAQEEEKRRENLDI